MEDLPQLAATQYRLADQFCDTCRNYHAIWPYRRLARVVATAEAGGRDFEATLAELFSAGQRRVLIAGAADAGLLALTARAGAAYEVDIVVLDRCRTPLELCRQFAQRWSLRADMLHQDLTNLDITAEFDVVFANSILLFIAPERRVDVLSRLGRTLRPNGRLVNVFNASARIAGKVVAASRADHSRWIIAELERRGVALPEPPEAFVRQLDEFGRDIDLRESTLNHLDQVLELHERAGFAVTRCVETDMGVTLPWRQLVAKLAKRRYMIVAEPTRNRSGN
jgi:SAM-dependent methyltransferase